MTVLCLISAIQKLICAAAPAFLSHKPCFILQGGTSKRGGIKKEGRVKEVTQMRGIEKSGALNNFVKHEHFHITDANLDR